MSSRSFDVVVVGAGPAGLAASTTAAGAGLRVALLDDTPWLGGQIWRGEQRQPKVPQAREWINRFSQSGAVLLERTAAVAAPTKSTLLVETADDAEELSFKKLILATGARELFLPFPGWTLPGVMGPGGLQALVKNGWPVSGRNVVIAGTGPLLLAVADGLKAHGARIISVNEQAPFSRIARFGLGLMKFPGKLMQGAGIKRRLLGTPHRFGVWPVRVEGDESVRSVTLTDGNRTWTENCDLFACGFNLEPNVELALALGCELMHGFVRVDELQQTSQQDIYCAGEPTGIGGADCALVEGQIAGYAAAGKQAQAASLAGERARWHRFRSSLAEAFTLREELKNLATPDTLLCRCEDVSLGHARQFDGWREAKLLSRCGMGPCQGRICGSTAKLILGWGMESVRPPVLPARVKTLTRTEETT